MTNDKIVNDWFRCMPRVILVLDYDKPLSHRDIFNKVGITYSHTHKVCKELFRLGMIKITKSEKQQNKNDITLTASGNYTKIRLLEIRNVLWSWR